MEHLKNLQLPINKQAIEVCRILQNSGHQSYIVGGCVRDILLKTNPKDWDITTSATPQQVMALFPKNYPTGLQHGTVTVSMGDGLENQFEVTTFRVEGKYIDGRRPEEVFFVTDIKEDLARRDLTINAMAYDPINNIMIDPFNGQNDLNNKIIKAVGNANDRFKEDGLRIMRVARFAARFGYSVHEETLNGMKSNLDTLKKVSVERIQDELSKTLMTSNPKLGLKLLKESGVLEIICPYLFSLTEHSYSKYNGELETRISTLYSSYKDIAEVKYELSELKFSNQEIKKTIFLLDLLLKYVEFSKIDNVLSYKEFMAHIKNNSPYNWEAMLEQFIILSSNVSLSSKETLSKYNDVVVFSRKEMQINGNDLMDIGIKPGPEIKRMLDKCYLEILFYPENNNKEILIKKIGI
ncbi:PcnB tRNA nucleotidyltransferase/poly(A) polymerase [uncultured Caudovirales phage]|uniref:PcnB tRNA nucleotidyltransferase/poly(A) polymerase n=1 Tax=uncultured Caudovirales phage TaxID=2100421 RepID=A0A6J5RSD9_9CAUD|nr:PcnB tRNA nucleotidyltransferase/poly(A) polymerase [uncultured Caudovirales phage]